MTCHAVRTFIFYLMFSRSFKNASGHHLILIKRCFHRSNIKFRQIWVVNSKITQSSDISQKQVCFSFYFLYS